MNNENRNIRELFISQSLKTCSDFYRSPKFRILSHSIKNMNNKKKIFTRFLKANTIIRDKNKKFFDSFHKSLMHRKLSSNQKYIDIEKGISYTERINKEKEKDSIEDYNNKNKNKSLKKSIKTLFLTNNNEQSNSNNKKNKHVKLMTTIYNPKNKISYKNNSLNIHSNIFLPFDNKRIRNNDYLNTINPKTDDFIENIKMIRTVKFINNIKTEQHKQQSALVGLETEQFDVTLYSLTNSIKLLNSYNSSFTNYNKFLINEIRKEKTILNQYITDENIIKEQVSFLQKQFDDLMLELEILTNFSNLFKAIKNKTIIKKDNKLDEKSFAELTKEKLRKIINLSQRNKFISTKYLLPKKNLIKKHIKDTKEIRHESKKKITLNIKDINKHSVDAPEKIIRKSRKQQTIIHFRNEKDRRKSERLYSFQPSSISKKNTIDNYNPNVSQIKSVGMIVKLDNYDIQKELKNFINNILNLIKKYNDIEYYIIYYKLLFDKEDNSIDISKIDQQRKENILTFNKNYNILLISKYNLLKSQKNDYSLIFFIYHKVNELIDSIKEYKIKKYQEILDNLINIYDNNKLFYKYKNEKNKNESLKAYLEKELINYLYKIFIWIEKLVYELIQGKNNYLSNNYYSMQIEKYENKRDIAKKIFNNKFKKNEEQLRRKKINEAAIKKWNKILFKPLKKVEMNYHIFKKTKKKEHFQINEDEDLLFY